MALGYVGDVANTEKAVEHLFIVKADTSPLVVSRNTIMTLNSEIHFAGELEARYIGNKLVDDEGYTYRKDRSVHGTSITYWRCSIGHKVPCKGRAKTIGNVLVNNGSGHTHAPI